MPRPPLSRRPIRDDARERTPRRSSSRRRRRCRGKTKEAAANDSFDDTATMIHPWAPSWSIDPVDRGAKPKPASRAPAISTPRGWQRTHSSVGGKRKLGLLEAAVVAAKQREMEWVEKNNQKNNNAGELFQVPVPCFCVLFCFVLFCLCFCF